MGRLTKRVAVTFEARQYALLEEIARREKKPVGVLIRDAVEKQYLQPTREEKMRALEWITSQNVDLPSWEVLKEEIAEDKIGRLDLSALDDID